MLVTVVSLTIIVVDFVLALIAMEKAPTLAGRLLAGLIMALLWAALFLVLSVRDSLFGGLLSACLLF